MNTPTQNTSTNQISTIEQVSVRADLIKLCKNFASFTEGASFPVEILTNGLVAHLNDEGNRLTPDYRNSITMVTKYIISFIIELNDKVSRLEQFEECLQGQN